MIAALFVDANGPYSKVHGVDPWDEARDARKYNGYYPIVAHPPCQRWGKYATGGPNPAATRRIVGDDGGCFAAALYYVRRYGGVLEHPAYSKAWVTHGLAEPSSANWIVADAYGYTAQTDQGCYGHVAKKATWLYAVGCMLPLLKIGAYNKERLDEGFNSAQHAKVIRAARAICGISARKRLDYAARIHTHLLSFATC